MDFQSEKFPSFNQDLNNAKLNLMKCSNATGDCLFDHLSAIIAKVLDEKPVDAVDSFEHISLKVKEERFRINENVLEESYIEPFRLETALKRLELLKAPKPELPVEAAEIDKEEDEDEEEIENEVEPPLRDIMQLQLYWNLLGIGFPPDEIFMLSVAMRKLKEDPKIHSCRFWGKVFCLKGNYFVVECMLTELELERRTVQTEIRTSNLLISSSISAVTSSNIDPSQTNIDESQHILKDRSNKTPEVTYKPPPIIPAEIVGQGVNRFIYFVCKNPGDEWIELPSVTPQQICVSRQIRKYFTGDLSHEIVSYPEFPGNEANYLRTAIARISAGTHISPIGYYKTVSLEEEEDSESEQLNNDQLAARNPNYKPISVRNLLEPNFWVHHQPNILDQGRVKWIDPKSLEKDDKTFDGYSKDGSDEEEDELEIEPPLAEDGPKLMTACSTDTTCEGVKVWSPKLTCISDSSNYVVQMRSNLWPGAFSFAFERIVDNIYFGFGHKYVSRNFNPAPLPPIQNQYPLGPEINELNDPTVQEEEAFRLAHLKAVESDLLDESEDEESEDE